MLANVLSAALRGIDAVAVQVEVNSGESGEPKLIMVGLPDAAVKESDDRVFSAVRDGRGGHWGHQRSTLIFGKRSPCPIGRPLPAIRPVKSHSGH